MPNVRAMCNFTLAGVSITEFGLSIPSPFVSLELDNSEIHTMTSWILNVTVGGDVSKKANVAAFEALIYSAAQATGYSESSGIPVSFMFGWQDANGNVSDYLSYQGFSHKFTVNANAQFINYKIIGFASLAMQSSLPILRIPAVCGIIQPSAVVEALAISSKATSYYELDIDHNDAPTLVSHGPLTTSFNKYVKGSYSGEDDYDTFPGLLSLSKSYSSSRDSAGLLPGYKKLSQVLNNAIVSPVSNFLKQANGDTVPQISSFSYWVDEPTMTQPGVIHYKSDAGLMTTHGGDILEYGTANTNILTLSGSYDGVAYNIGEMRFSQVGFTVDAIGNTVLQDSEVVNSWSSSLANVFQSADIINDVNAVATQFAADFTVSVMGNTKKYTIAQPVSLIVMSGGTLSPITGIYNIMSVGHKVDNQFVTTLKLKRLSMSRANQVATAQGVYVSGSSNIPSSAIPQTPNIISTAKADLGTMHPTFEHMTVSM